MAAAAFAVFAALALAVRGERELGWDGAVLDLLARFPVASSDVHVDPFATAADSFHSSLAREKRKGSEVPRLSSSGPWDERHRPVGPLKPARS